MARNWSPISLKMFCDSRMQQETFRNENFVFIYVLNVAIRLL